MKVREITVYEAAQWNKLGDHPRVISYHKMHPECELTGCPKCNRPLEDHGWLIGSLDFESDTPQNDNIVCPGLWLLKESRSIYFGLLHDTTFRKNYEIIPSRTTHEHKNLAKNLRAYTFGGARSRDTAARWLTKYKAKHYPPGIKVKFGKHVLEVTAPAPPYDFPHRITLLYPSSDSFSTELQHIKPFQ